MASIRIPISRPSMGPRERDNLLQAFDSTWISSSGSFLDEFEERFADFCGVKHALAVTNGTVALHLTLLALGIGPGDEVIVPSLTYIATANAVTYCGASPVFADVADSDWGLDTNSVQSLITKQTRAVIAVHLYGVPCDMRALRQLCADEGIFLVEDAAEAHFSERDGLHAGGMGDVATFSFYGNKVLSSGEGGAVTTNSEKLAQAMRLIRGQGMSTERRYWFPIIGHNFRMTNLAASLLCAQLDRSSAILERRSEIYARYEAMLHTAAIDVAPSPSGATSTPWLFCVIVGNRDQVASELASAGVETRPFFIPIHTMPPYARARHAADMRVTTRLAAQGLNLPTFPEMDDRDVDFVSSLVCQHARR